MAEAGPHLCTRPFPPLDAFYNSQFFVHNIVLFVIHLQFLQYFTFYLIYGNQQLVSVLFKFSSIFLFIYFGNHVHITSILTIFYKTKGVSSCFCYFAFSFYRYCGCSRNQKSMALILLVYYYPYQKRCKLPGLQWNNIFYHE